jgi:predicted lipid-binding transport protein (Tim44 family)
MPAGGLGQPAPAEPARFKFERGAGIRPGSAMDEFMRGGAVNPAAPWGVPADFDTAGFLARAKEYFGRLQSAWDKGQLEELQQFATDAMFIAITHDLRARGPHTSRTEIESLEAILLGIESVGAEHVASVRFTGTLRVDGEAEPVDEVWNLSKSADGRSGWLLAGIQQIG